VFRPRWLIAGAAILSGCAIAPSLPDESRVSVEDIVKLTKCELRDALLHADKTAPWFDKWAAAAELTLKVGTQAGGQLGTPTFLIPINIGTWSMGFDVGGGANANGVAKIKFATKLEALRDLDCPPRGGGDENPIGATRDLGLSAWLIRALDSANAAQLDERSTKSMGYTIEFVVFVNGAVAPKWDVLYGHGRRFNIGPRVNGEIRDSHIVDIALVPPSQRPEPTEVIVVADRTQKKTQPSTEGAPVPPAEVAPPRPQQRRPVRRPPEASPGVDARTLRDLDNTLNGLQGERRVPDLDR
jgi:hypothetical protein